MENTNFDITYVLVEDEKVGGFTCYFAQLPNIVAEGDTEEEAKENLRALVKAVFNHQKSSVASNLVKGHHVKTESVEVLIPA